MAFFVLDLSSKWKSDVLGLKMATNSQRGEDFDFKNLAWQVFSIAFLRSGRKISTKNAI